MSNDEPPAKRARVDVAPETVDKIMTALRHLDEHGYAVIPDLVSAEVCDRSAAGIRAFLAEAGVDVYGESTKLIHPHSHCIVQHLEAGHAQAIWDIRLQRPVIDVFERLWGTNDLLSSFDGFCWMPRNYRFSGRSWLHTDQSHKKPGHRATQAYVNLTTSHDDQSGSLVVVPGSHRRHAAFALNHPDALANGKDWWKFSVDDLAELGGEPIRVHGGKGSMVLWDSRTAHEARGPPRIYEQTRERCVVYVCMQPRAFCSATNLAKKQAAFNAYRMTTHWPASKIELFSKTWRTFGEPIAVVTPHRTRVESQRMLELAGVVPLTSEPLRRCAPAIKFQ